MSLLDSQLRVYRVLLRVQRRLEGSVELWPHYYPYGQYLPGGAENPTVMSSYHTVITKIVICYIGPYVTFVRCHIWPLKWPKVMMALGVILVYKCHFGCAIVGG